MANHTVAAELKEKAIMRLMPPYNWMLRQVADEIGAGVSTVWQWRKQLEMEGLIAQKEDTADERSPEQIFTIILETAPFSEHQLAEYCREKGLYVDQVKQWMQNCIGANQPASRQRAEAEKQTRADKSRIRVLEKELRRKDKALAETAALLVLQKKLDALWEDEEEN